MKKILIIDDEADVRRYLTAILKKHGYEILTASDGVEGLEIARRERPDLVTLDLMMPNQSGTDFYRNLIKDKELGETPVIVVSGLPGRHLAVKRPAAIFDKPIDPEALVAAVREALGNGAGGKARD
jgi:DNA-binding response OmpR family regulator